MSLGNVKNTSTSSPERKKIVFIGQIGSVDEWKRDYPKDTKKYITWLPSRHVISETDFANTLKIPDIFTKMKKGEKCISTETPGMYVECGDTQFDVIRLKIPDVEIPEIICYWPSESRDEIPLDEQNTSEQAAKRPKIVGEDIQDDIKPNYLEVKIKQLQSENEKLRTEIRNIGQKHNNLRSEFESFRQQTLKSQRDDKLKFEREMTAIQEIVRRIENPSN